MAFPIWRTVRRYYSSQEPQAFRITTGGQTIYSGVATPKNGQIYVEMNNICSDFLSQSYPQFTKTGYSNAPNLSKSFELMFGEDVAFNDSFYMDWSYDYDFANIPDANKMLSRPITGEVDSRQDIVVTKLANAGIKVKLIYKNGNVEDLDFPNSTPESDFSGNVNFVFHLKDYKDVAKVIIDDLHYKVVDECHRYIIYYVNSFGGWDSLLAKGNFVQTDNIKRNVIKKEYGWFNFFGESYHERLDYVNEVYNSFEFNTGWITGENGEKMHNLINTNMAVLKDLESPYFRPIILTDSSCRYKTYKNNGHQPVTFDIRGEFSIDRIRKSIVKL